MSLTRVAAPLSERVIIGRRNAFSLDRSGRRGTSPWFRYATSSIALTNLGSLKNGSWIVALFRPMLNDLLSLPLVSAHQPEEQHSGADHEEPALHRLQLSDVLAR